MILFPHVSNFVSYSFMSEENVPKLRLKPKLVIDPIPLESIAPLEPISPEASPSEEPKAIRLKPRLSPPPPESSEPSASYEPSAAPENPLAVAETPAVFATGESAPPPAGEKPATKFSLKPKALSDPVPMDLPPLVEESPDGAPSLFPPAGSAPGDQLIGEVQPEARAGTVRPFPPPPANFPPPSSAPGKPAPPWARPAAAAASPKKNFVRLGGGVVVVLVVLGGVFVGYRKFAAETPVLPKAEEKAFVKPAVEEKPAPEKVEPVKEPAPASVQPVAEPEPVVEPVEVAPPPPPPPSVAFRAWVDNLRISGVRTGSETKVFIGGTSYEAGEIVNPQLGIIFESYNVETRRLTFRDKTGAAVERRN